MILLALASVTKFCGCPLPPMATEKYCMACGSRNRGFSMKAYAADHDGEVADFGKDCRQNHKDLRKAVRTDGHKKYPYCSDCGEKAEVRKKKKKR